MWTFAIGFWHRIAGHTNWHEVIKGDRFIWRRWTSNGWDYRDMTQAEQADAIAAWAIR